MNFTLENIKYKEILDIPYLALTGPGVTCIVGESGSGKTTLLKLLNNLISPDQGQVLYNEVNLEELDPVQLRRQVVMFPQNPSIFPGSIQDNLQLGLEFAGKPLPSVTELNHALDLANLEKPLDAGVEELSGGEQQRLALARLFLLEPEVLLLDEPSSALDDTTEVLVLNSINNFAQSREITLIMVTHSKAVANKYAETIITIHNGQVIGNQEVAVRG